MVGLHTNPLHVNTPAYRENMIDPAQALGTHLVSFSCRSQISVLIVADFFAEYGQCLCSSCVLIRTEVNNAEKNTHLNNVKLCRVIISYLHN